MSLFKIAGTILKIIKIYNEIQNLKKGIKI